LTIHPPSIGITSPSDGSTVAGPIVTIQFSVSDNHELATLTITIDGQSHSLSVTDTRYDWDITATPPRLHTITLTAMDAKGNTAIHTITVLISPHPDSYQAGFAMALIIRIPIALIIGLVIGYLIKRRKSRPIKEGNRQPTGEPNRTKTATRSQKSPQTFGDTLPFLLHHTPGVSE